MNETDKKTVGICDTQPIACEGLRILLSSCPDLEFSRTADTLAGALQVAASGTADIMLVDKSFGLQAVLDWIGEVRSAEVSQRDHANPDHTTKVVVWGGSMTEAEALRLLQAGAKGIIRKTAELPMLIACLRSVAAGRSWMEDCVFRDPVRSDRYSRSELTPREQQVMELVEQGFKNKEIASELGIRPGTVKIHLKHIFEKTGVRGRYGLALTSLKDKGIVSMVAS